MMIESFRMASAFAVALKGLPPTMSKKSWATSNEKPTRRNTLCKRAASLTLLTIRPSGLPKRDQAFGGGRRRARLSLPCLYSGTGNSLSMS